MKAATHKTTIGLTDKNRAYLEGMGFISGKTGHSKVNRRKGKKDVSCLGDFINECVTMVIEHGMHSRVQLLPPTELAMKRLLYEQAKYTIQQDKIAVELKRVAKAMQEVRGMRIEHDDEVHALEALRTVRNDEQEREE